MGTLDNFFDPTRLNNLWKSHLPYTQEIPKISLVQQTFQELVNRIVSELPQKKEILQPYLDEISQLLAEREKGNLSKSELAKNREKLKEIYQNVEDFLDVFLLS